MKFIDSGYATNADYPAKIGKLYEYQISIPKRIPFRCEYYVNIIDIYRQRLKRMFSGAAIR
jgi:hypothetical protein